MKHRLLFRICIAQKARIVPFNCHLYQPFERSKLLHMPKTMYGDSYI